MLPEEHHPEDSIPDWDDDFQLPPSDDDDPMLPNPTRDALAALARQWRRVLSLLKVTLGAIGDGRSDEESGSPERDFRAHLRTAITADALLVLGKLHGAVALGNWYVPLMAQAAIIRENAQRVMSTLLLLDDALPQDYIRLVRAEIDTFRALFKSWVASFRPDDRPDEWGLFR